MDEFTRARMNRLLKQVRAQTTSYLAWLYYERAAGRMSQEVLAHKVEELKYVLGVTDG